MRRSEESLKEYIYLIQEREFVKSNEQTYKIGRTSSLYNRVFFNKMLTVNFEVIDDGEFEFANFVFNSPCGLNVVFHLSEPEICSVEELSVHA